MSEEKNFVDKFEQVMDWFCVAGIGDPKQTLFDGRGWPNGITSREVEQTARWLRDGADGKLDFPSETLEKFAGWLDLCTQEAPKR